jgi:O-antigen ligase
MAADKLERPVDGSISVDRELTWLAFLRLLTAASVFWLALQLCRDASRADLLLSSIAAIGCAYAAYGLFAFALAPGRILWFKSPEGQVVTSTFVNRNSFAAYAGISFIVFCGLILRLYGQELKTGAGSIRFRIANFIEVTGKQGVVLLCGAFVALTALLATGSRGGISSSMFGLLVLALLALRLRKRQLEQYAIIIFCTLLVGAAFLAFGDLVAGRIALQGFGDQSRIAVYKLVMISILDVPLLGYGYGTFADVFPMFRDNSVSTFGQWQMAHNTYLELFQGLGVLFGAMFLASIVLLAWRCVEGATGRRMNVTPACVAASVAVLLGVDSLVDFSLQMQAIAITFMALLGTGVAQSESSQLVLSD